MLLKASNGMMNDNKTVSRITAFINRGVAKNVLDSLKEIGIVDLYLTAGRSPVIKERRGIFVHLPGHDLVEDPIDIIAFLVTQDMEGQVLDLIIEKGELTLPGRGTVYSEEVSVPIAYEILKENRPSPFEAKKSGLRAQQLEGISCIVQRGQGNNVARIALDAGACVPAIHYSIGTGVRDKMGLLRITIPAEKEVITLATSAYDADVIMEMMIDVGKLGQPGKGFIYLYPLKKGLVNIQVTRGEQRQAASIEQIVATLDHIKGDTEWRRWSGLVEKTGVKIRYLIGLVDLTLLCDAGTGAGLVKTAMSAGAPGATINKLKYIRPLDSPLSQISPSREACSMIVSEDQMEGIIDALKKAGAFTELCHGQLQARRIKKAFTYMSK